MSRIPIVNIERVLKEKGSLGEFVVEDLLDNNFYEITVVIFQDIESDNLSIANAIRNYKGIGNDRYHISGNRIIAVVQLIEEQDDIKKYFQELHKKIQEC